MNRTSSGPFYLYPGVPVVYPLQSPYCKDQLLQTFEVQTVLDSGTTVKDCWIHGRKMAMETSLKRGEQETDSGDVVFKMSVPEDIDSEWMLAVKVQVLVYGMEQWDYVQANQTNQDFRLISNKSNVLEVVHIPFKKWAEMGRVLQDKIDFKLIVEFDIAHCPCYCKREMLLAEARRLREWDDNKKQELATASIEDIGQLLKKYSSSTTMRKLIKFELIRLLDKSTYPLIADLARRLRVPSEVDNEIWSFGCIELERQLMGK